MKLFLFKNTDEVEVLNAINTVLNGEKYYPDNFKKIFFKNENHKLEFLITDNPAVRKRYREIMYLFCLNKNTDEISKILNVSDRTIDADRRILYRKQTHKGLYWL